ncbi:DUF1294 domain-containing protein [Neobacillus cucumis]|uniref:DUF1294 domain-containing protein n=1 Tax=Bacillaceae TaxID=186817 RepID=UPI001E5E7018|nr:MULTISPECIES: DUF1294 domain-containing protein [Bacillaceae]MED1469314.1 DUF1294 domain-containing protein [Bacillus salipaludis]WHY90731.1 DUF1294 domain-containing protein [Neobacillus cucumis]
MEGNTLLLVVYIIMNVAGLIIMWEDKQRAIHHKYRIQEKTLWLVALFGGAIGATMGMQLYRHKTKHVQFKIGFPLLAVIEFILMLYLFLKY